VQLLIVNTKNKIPMVRPGQCGALLSSFDMREHGQ
jgi:hypothetical protein